MTLQVGDRDGAIGTAGPASAPFRLSRAAAELYGDLPDVDVLDLLLTHTARITGSASAAVSVVDTAAGRYRKAAEHGVACRVGCTFSLDEGATGRAVAQRRPIVVDDYATIASGHLPEDETARRRAVVAVPIWWRSEVIAVTVAFRPHGAGFPVAMVDALESLTQVASAAVLHVGLGDPGPTGALLRRPRPADGASPLTRREAQVLALVRRGWSDRQIAAQLLLSPKTVEKHVGALLRKTGAANRTAAVVVSAERGWSGSG